MIRKDYLGDGVYAAFDGLDVVLTTENGVSETNRIVLEGPVLFAFEAWVARLREDIREQRKTAKKTVAK